MTRVFERRLLLCACLLLTAGTALAQHGPPGSGGGMGGGMGGQHGGGFPGLGGPVGPTGERSGPLPSIDGRNGSVRGGLRLGPPGRWWDDHTVAKSLGLRKDQQKRMDTVFDANKGAILESYKALQKQESILEATTRESKLDEGKIFAAIDAVNQARSALEKANAHMLLMVRQELDADQSVRMEKLLDAPPPAEE
jgi:hypothetical protein